MIKIMGDLDKWVPALGMDKPLSGVSLRIGWRNSGSESGKLSPCAVKTACSHSPRQEGKSNDVEEKTDNCSSKSLQ